MKKARFLAALAAGILACSAPLPVSADEETASEENLFDVEAIDKKVNVVLADYLGTDEWLEEEKIIVNMNPSAISYDKLVVSKKGLAFLMVSQRKTNDGSVLNIRITQPGVFVLFALISENDSLDFSALQNVDVYQYTPEQIMWGHEGDENWVYDGMSYYDVALDRVNAYNIPNFKECSDDAEWNLLIYDTYAALRQMKEDGILNSIGVDYPVFDTAGTTFSLNAGDLNDDVQTDVKDAVLLSRVVAEDPELTLSAAGRINADLDDDGAYTVDDLTLLLAKISGK